MSLTVAGFFGTPCILYYTLYSLKETLRDQCTPTQKVKETLRDQCTPTQKVKETLRNQCTPTQKVMLLLFIINPLIQENTNNVVKGTSNEAFCLFKIGLIDVLCKQAVIVKKNLIE